MLEEVARRFALLGDPTRLRIVRVLHEYGGSTVGEIAAALGISSANASQHLAFLRDRGVVKTRRAGTHAYYALTSDKVVQAVDLLCEFMAERRVPGSGAAAS